MNSQYDWTKLFGGIPGLPATGNFQQPQQPTTPTTSLTTGNPQPSTQQPQQNQSQLLGLISSLFSSNGLIGRPGRQLNINGEESNSNFGTAQQFQSQFPGAQDRAAEEERILGTRGATGNILAGIPFQQNPVQLAQFQQQARQNNTPAANPDGTFTPPPPYQLDERGILRPPVASPSAPGPAGIYSNGKRQKNQNTNVYF